MENEKVKAMLVCGVSGAGKTTFARGLSEREGYVRLSLDELAWEKFGAAFADMPGPDQGAELRALQPELRRRMSDVIARGRAVVVDFPMCKRSVRDEFRAAATAAGADVQLVFMDTPLDELRRRLAARKFTDANSLPVSAEMVGRFFAGFQRPDSDENAMVITAD